jgi:hypothetical protein
MALVRTHTAHIAGLPLEADNVGGDPSPCTARGVFPSMELAAHRRLHRPLSDCTIAIQGVGHLGAALAQMLHQAGAQLLVSDVNAAAVARVAIATGATVVRAAGILSAEADIFASCALGGVIEEVAAGKLRAKVVCGAANNQLATTADGDRLAQRDILYALDYVVNAGGIINVAAEYLGWPQADSNARVEATADRLADAFTHAEAHGVAPTPLPINWLGSGSPMPRWTRLTNSLSLRDRGPISYSRGRLARHAFACARPHVATGCNCLSCRHRQRGGRLLRLGRDLSAAPTVDGRENPRHDPRQFGRTRPLGRQDH